MTDFTKILDKAKELEAKSSEAYKIVMKKFPDAELVDVKLNGKEEDKND